MTIRGLSEPIIKSIWYINLSVAFDNSFILIHSFRNISLIISIYYLIFGLLFLTQPVTTDITPGPPSLNT